MPSGKVHAACSVALAPVCGGLTFAFTGEPLLAVAAAGGCALGILLTPDLDQQSLCSSEAAVVRYTLGLGFLWVMAWYPYAALIKHRSPLSHAPLLGTAGRVLYLGAIAAIPAFLWGWDFQISAAMMPAVLAGVAGLAVSDTAHFVMDVISTRIGRTKRKISKMTGGIL